MRRSPQEIAAILRAKERVEASFAALGLPYAADPDPCPRADLRVVHH